MIKENIDYINRIKNDFQLNYPVARYLAKVTPSKDFEEYENHKKTLFKLCSSPEEYEKANKCLVELMTI